VSTELNSISVSVREADLSDDAVEQMITLAERLRKANGGTLDDDAIQAVAEATGAPTEYVRLAVKVRTDRTAASGLTTVRAQFLTLDPETRRMVAVGTMAAFTALLYAINWRFASYVSQYGILQMLGLLTVSVGIYQTALAKDTKSAAVCGAILGGGAFALFALFSMIFRTAVSIQSLALVPVAIGAAVGGGLLQRLVSQHRERFGLKDPVRERMELLSQLVELQDRLRQNERHMTFLSVDIVGSTKMKERADQLSIEYTFNEYHQFVEKITLKFGGRIHSTAGDGVTCAFEHPSQAFAAGKAIQGALPELNTYRNRIGVPIQVRCGVHTGSVVAPDTNDITTLNFSHVIDIAAHVQKVCPPGGVAVSETAAMYLPGGPKAVGQDMIDSADIPAAIWLPRTTLTVGRAISTPPAPLAP
jgi:class 3 adenylate cyclase